MKKYFLCKHVEAVNSIPNLRLCAEGHSNGIEPAICLLDVANGHISAEQSLDEFNIQLPENPSLESGVLSDICDFVCQK